MATTTIPWDDGSGDNIYFDYPSDSGDETVTVTSDPNRGDSTRSQVVTFSGVNANPVTLTVNQPGGAQQYTVTFIPSFYDQTDYSYKSLNNPSRAYAGHTSGNYCGIVLANGDRAETWVYWGFDTSSIPNGARILSVSCKAKGVAGTGNTNAIAAKYGRLYSGTTTPKSNSKNFPASSGSAVDIESNTTWTYEEVQNVLLKTYARRGTLNTSTGYSLNMYGATLTVTYVI